MIGKRTCGMALAFLTSAACSAASQDETDAATYDAIPPEITEHMGQPAVLVFSKTMSWRHDEGIAGADLFFVQLANEKGWGIYTTENGAVFTPEILERFAVVVFNNVTGDVLSPDQEAAFEAWVEAGGGFIGLHGSGDASSEEWAWYRQNLIGPDYMNHVFDPQFQEARVEILRPGHPVAAGLPSEWMQEEEWYTFYSNAGDEGFTTILGLDETTYRPWNDVWEPGPDLRMGDEPKDHPVVWANCRGEGRSVYSAIGHRYTAYEVEPYAGLLRNAFAWVAKETDSGGEGCP